MYICFTQKTEIMNALQIFFENIILLLGSLFSGTTQGMTSNKPIYNQDFVAKFSTAQDRERLENKINELKMDDMNDTGEIELSSKEKVTIVVN